MAVVEVAIAMFNSPNPIGARVGSIVVSRKPLGIIGKKECCQYVWLQLEGPREQELLNLCQAHYADEKTRFVILKKFRYLLRVTDMVTESPGFSVLDAMDMNKPYQPFCNVDEHTGKYELIRGPLSARLVIDTSK